MSDDHHLIRRHFGEDRSLGDRAADRFVAVFGSWSYIIWQTIAVVLWIIGNVFLMPFAGVLHTPDPYPFILLNLLFSTQASYAAPLILMAQNRQAARDKDFAAHQFRIIERLAEAMGELISINRRQLDILTELHELRQAVEDKP